MVVVVPSLPQRGQGQPQIVARIAVRVELATEAPRAHDVRQGVDAVAGKAPSKASHAHRAGLRTRPRTPMVHLADTPECTASNSNP